MEETAVVAALQAGDEAAFVALVETYHGAMVRVALGFVASREVAEEVAQEAWLGVLNGIGRFESRSSLKTWIFRILTNIARTRGAREARTTSFASAFGDAGGEDGPTVDPSRFRPTEPFTGGWLDAPRGWGESAEQSLLSAETQALIAQVVAGLPPAQRQTITLRDIEGLSSEEACNALGVSETNQRVLLHRARAKVRQALERYFEGG